MKTLSIQYSTFLNVQEGNRAFWTVLALLVQSNVLAPLTLASMNFYHGGDWQILVCVLCFFGVVIPILSAQPVKYGINAFLFSIIVHLFIITLNLLG